MPQDLRSLEEPGAHADGEGRASRRKFVRYLVELPCRFSGDRSTHTGTVTDVSSGGCKVETDGEVSPGEYLQMSVQSVLRDSPIGVDLAVVRWVGRGAFGVEFIRMEPLPQDRLRLLVRYIEQDHALGLRRAEPRGKREASDE